ncbi:MAG: GAF and ANTAR domain-containing protein, partial [Acidimicrobiales bacterium]
MPGRGPRCSPPTRPPRSTSSSTTRATARASRERSVVRIGSNRTDTRWPAFSARAVEHGVLSSLSAPLVAQKRGLGALNFYGVEESAFTEDDAQVGLAFSAQAAIVVANAQAYWGARDKSLHLDEAMRSRAPIEQAKGIIVARSRLSPDAAFDILVRASQRENRKLRDIATELVERAQQPGAAPLED